MKELPKAFEAKQFEDAIYKSWEDSGYFNPDNLPGKGQPFSMSLPPPNATGILHLGHTVMMAIQDIITRYHRMKGDKTLWLPGTDHAAIATQNVVEKQMWESEKKTRFDLPREEFLKKVSAFAENSKGTIRSQLRAVGSSCDWSRERYTLDEGLSEAVTKAFVTMYQDGLIYRGKRIVNWCYRCGTTLADDEVDYKESKTKFYYLKYGPIVIGTARPETKVQDKIIIVHPDDERYKKYIGTEFTVPWIDGEVKAKVVADKVAEINTGTGAMTITPAHSFVDFDLAQKYGFEILEIIGPDGKMTPNAGKFAGLNVKTARQAIVEELEKKGLIDHIDENYVHNLSVCYRCGTPVEPLPSEQWFVAVNKPYKTGWLQSTTLKKMAQKAVSSGQIKIIPDKFNKTYDYWMDNLHDWCISRQIWFGHRIPAWRCLSCNHWLVTEDKPTEFIFSRHAPTDWNNDGIIQGHTEVPINEDEVDKVVTWAKDLKSAGIELIISSPLMRARQTAAILSKELNVGAEVDDLLIERDYGEFEKTSVKEIKKVHPDYYKDKISYDVPGAEDYTMLNKRLTHWVKNVQQKNRGKKILVITHNSVMRALKGLFENSTNQELTDYRPKFTETLSYSFINECHKCSGLALVQDQDTLDTWFSSSLWTFSTLGWPKQTADLKNYHPTTVMETGYDILFFWVARMILMTGYLLKQVPFKTVYLHGLVRDKQGRKMSKSLGNGIDPLNMIEKYGTDALRLSMIVGTTPGNDFRLYEEKISGYRNFVNKLWNICRYALLTVNEVESKATAVPKTLADRWILSRLNTVTNEITNHIDRFEFSPAAEKLYDFTWHELADWYLEIAKIEKDKDALLSHLLTTVVKLWHPFTPYVTEVIWREMFGTSAMLMIESWPTTTEKPDTTAEADIKIIQDIVTAIRNFRTENKLTKEQILDCGIKLVNFSGPKAEAMAIITGLRTKINIVENPDETWTKLAVGDNTIYLNF